MQMIAAMRDMLLILLIGAQSLQADEIVVKPPPGPGPLDNPLKGWCPYTDAGQIHQPYSMVFLYVPWKQLEPHKGDYQFEAWERTWDVDEARGKHIVFRVYVDYPSLDPGLPDWLRQEGVRETAYREHGGGMSPDYNDPRMVSAMERLIEALGRRYNNHPRIAFLQLGLLGFWGEWHTWPREEMYASPQTEQRVIDSYRRAFPDKSLMVRYARDYAGQLPWIGFHDDMFPQDTDNGEDWSFLSGLRNSGRMNNWNEAVVGGEMVPNKAGQWLGRKFETTQAMLDRAHFTWVGPYCPALERTKDDDFRRRSEELVRRMGYEFQWIELRHPEVARANTKFVISLKGRNSGVAPFYYPWSVEWSLINPSDEVVATQTAPWDIRSWKPGQIQERAELSFDVPAGNYRLALGIRDPWQDRPAIRFANEADVIDGWTVLSRLRVGR